MLKIAPLFSRMAMRPSPSDTTGRIDFECQILFISFVSEERPNPRPINHAHKLDRLGLASVGVSALHSIRILLPLRTAAHWSSAQMKSMTQYPLTMNPLKRILSALPRPDLDDT